MVLADGKRYGFEFKLSDAPRRSRSMLTALEDLALTKLWVVYPGDRGYDLHEKIHVSPIPELRREWANRAQS